MVCLPCRDLNRRTSGQGIRKEEFAEAAEQLALPSPRAAPGAPAALRGTKRLDAGFPVEVRFRIPQKCLDIGDLAVMMDPEAYHAIDRRASPQGPTGFGGPRDGNHPDAAAFCRTRGIVGSTAGRPGEGRVEMTSDQRR